jgi:hypothetical protein
MKLDQIGYWSEIKIEIIEEKEGHPIIGYLIKGGRKDYSGKDRKYGFNIS